MNLHKVTSFPATPQADAMYLLEASGRFAARVTDNAGSYRKTGLQEGYNESVSGDIVTDATLGALKVKRGSAADTDNVLEILNGAGAVTAGVRGDGRLFSNELDVANSASIGGANTPVDNITLRAQKDFSTTNSPRQLRVAGNMEATGGTGSAYGIYAGMGYTVNSGNTHANANTARFDTPSITVTSGNLTEAATVHVGSAPAGGLNNYALSVGTGLSLIRGSLKVDDAADPTTFASDAALRIMGGAIFGGRIWTGGTINAEGGAVILNRANDGIPNSTLSEYRAFDSAGNMTDIVALNNGSNKVIFGDFNATSAQIGHSDMI